jgi:hypothetical protein
MSNGEVCCLLGICCPPEKQREAVMALAHKFKIGDAEAFCDWWCDHINAKKILGAIGDRLGG